MSKRSKIMSYAFTDDEKRTISILSFGTFLEYFDLFLFIHLASKINETFFAPGDKSSFLVTSIAYITSNLFRPFGAIILGYLGDKIGRVYTLYVTLCLMGLCSIGVVVLPTYAQMGVAASWFISLFRGIQSISSMGEIISSRIYLQENLKGTKIATANCLLMFGCFFGGHFSILAVKFANDFNLNFRYLFGVGFLVFMLGLSFRKNLAENREFNISRKIKNETERVSLRLCLAISFVISVSQVMWSVAFIIINQKLKTDLSFSDYDIVNHNANVNWGYMMNFLIYYVLTCRVYPGYISFAKNLILLSAILILPEVLASNVLNDIFLLQRVIVLCAGDPTIDCLLLANLPQKFRMLVGCLTFALPKFFVVGVLAAPNYLLADYGYYAYSLICAPLVLLGLWGIYTLTRIDKKNSNGFYKNYKNKLITTL